MALTRPYLKSLGIEGDKIDSIIEAHVDTIDGLKSTVESQKAEIETLKGASAERDKYKVDLEKAQKQVNTLTEKVSAYDGLVQERDQLKTEVDSLNGKINEFTTKETATNTELTDLREKVSTYEADKNTANAEVERIKTEFEAYKTQINNEKTTAKKNEAVRAVLRNGGVVRPDFQDLIIGSLSMDSVSLDENGAVVDADKLIESTQSKYPSCFGTVTVEGAPKVEPMGGTPKKLLTKAQIEAMSEPEINANWELVQASLQRLGQ